MNARSGKPKGVVDAARLSGPEKAAVVLLALGEEHAGVWRQLDEEEIKVISQAMAGLGQVTSAVVEDSIAVNVPSLSVYPEDGINKLLVPEDPRETNCELTGFPNASATTTLRSAVLAPSATTTVGVAVSEL